MLLGAALLLDPKTLNIVNPNAFITGTGLYFVFGLSSFWWVQQDRLPMPLPTMLFSLLAGDVFFLSLVMYAGGTLRRAAADPAVPAARRGRLDPAHADRVLPRGVRRHLPARPRRLPRAPGHGRRRRRCSRPGIIGFGYFATVGIAVALGRYTKQSEDLAAQRGIDVANLEQVNRLIIQDMQDGVLVVDLNGVVRGHNAQVTRLLGGFGRMRGGMRLAEFSTTLHDYWRRWQEDFTEALPPFKVEATQRLLRVRLVRIGTGLNGGTLIYLEDLGRAQTEAQQMKLAAMGRLTASIAHEVRNPLSAINQAAQLLEEDGAVAPEGARLLGMIRNNAKRIDRIVGEVLQFNRRDRQQPETVPLADFMRTLIDEIVQAENMPPGSVVLQIPDDLLIIFDRGHLNQIVWNLVRNAWQHCQKKEGSIRVLARAGYMGDAVICELMDDGPGIPAELRPQIFEPFFTTRPGGTGLGLYIARELADANGAALELLPKGPGAHFRMTLKRASIAGDGRHDARARRRNEGEHHDENESAVNRRCSSSTTSRTCSSSSSSRCRAWASTPRAPRPSATRSACSTRSSSTCASPTCGCPTARACASSSTSTRRASTCPVAVITAFGSAENAVAALKAGAFDYLAKPVALEQLRALVKQALKVPEKEQPASQYNLLGESPAMQQVRGLIDRLAKSQAPVFINGESGSGKELAARTIHLHGPRGEQPFVAVNCGAIPENLMESEFFGYRKGAFTGRRGRPRRLLPGRQRRHAVPRRSGRPAARDAGEAPARDPGEEGAQGRRHAGGAGRRADHQRHAQEAHRAGRVRQLPAGPLLPAARDRAQHAEPARDARGHSAHRQRDPREAHARRHGAARARRRSRRSSSTRSPATCASSRTSSSAGFRWPPIRCASLPKTCT